MATLCHTEYTARKRALLEDSLLNLMGGKAYQDISVTDICREADIPRRTFYHYYESKEDVLDSLIEALMQQCFMDVMFDFRRGPEYMKSSFSQVFHFWEGEKRKKLDALIQNGLESRLIAWASQWIRGEQSNMLQNSGLDPKTVEIGLMVGTTGFFSLLLYWSRGGYQESPEQMAEYAVWVLPQALCNK